MKGFSKGHTPWNKGIRGIHLSPSSEFKKGLIPWNKGVLPSCVDCGKKSYWIKKTNRCHKCYLRSWSDIKNHPRFLKDRSIIKLDKERGGPLHKQWSKSVKNRDGWRCKISNSDCSGRLESHHILGWESNPELRYEINNGITLCHFHHPRKREDEKRLSPYFQDLVSVSK